MRRLGLLGGAALALVSGCRTGPFDGADGAIPDGGSIDQAVVDLRGPADLAQQQVWLHFTWTVHWNDQPATCADAGAVAVELWAGTPYPPHQPLASFACGALEGLAGPYPPGVPVPAQFPHLVARDAQGYLLTVEYSPFESTEVQPTPGVHEMAPVIFSIYDEPVPQLRRMFQGAEAYWQAHSGTLPPSQAMTPAQGACCATNEQICPPMPAFWQSPTWIDLGFAIAANGRYSYAFRSDPSANPPTFRVTASSDLTCVGTFSSWWLDGTLAAGADGGASFSGIDNLQVQNRGE